MWTQPGSFFFVEHYIALDSAGIVALQLELSGDSSGVSERPIAAYEWVRADDDGLDVMEQLRSGTYRFDVSDLLYRNTDKGHVVAPPGSATAQAVADKLIKRVFAELWAFDPELFVPGIEALARYEMELEEQTCPSGIYDQSGYPEPPSYWGVTAFGVLPNEGTDLPILHPYAPWDYMSSVGNDVTPDQHPAVQGEWYSCYPPSIGNGGLYAFDNELTVTCWSRDVGLRFKLSNETSNVFLGIESGGAEYDNGGSSFEHYISDPDQSGWHHYAYTLSAGGDGVCTVQWYIDGALYASEDANNVNLLYGEGLWLFDKSDVIFLSFGDTSGYVGDFRLHNGVLSESTIQQLAGV